jgi:hypothetical protein
VFRIGLSALTASLLALGVGLDAAQAQSRVFVAAQGSDGNPCSFALPCRTFQHAHDVVAANGEIDVLDPAGYGLLTISKAISIQGHGFAGISVPAANAGIQVVAGANDQVHLNGLLIDGGGVGTHGIVFDSGRRLTLENCIVRNMTGNGLWFLSVAPLTAPQGFGVSNSYFSDNGGDGIHVNTESAGNVRGTIDRTVMSHNHSKGLTMDGSAGTGLLNVAVTDSVFEDNENGFFVKSASGQSDTRLLVTRTLVANNITAIETFGTNARLWLVQNTVMGNADAFIVGTGSVINSFGDNSFAANVDFVGSLTVVGKQ